MKHRSILFNDNAIINYQDEGQGDITLVLLHGFMNSLDVWASYAFKYMKEIRIIAIDLLGHGESSSIAETHTMELQAQMVKSVLDNLGIKDCVIAGHSMGGYIALSFAELYPQYVKGLCLVNSHALEDNEKAKENRLKMCTVIENNRASFIVSFIPELFYETKREEFYPEIKDLQEVAMQMEAKSIIAAQKGMIERHSQLNVLIEAKHPFMFIIGKKDPRIIIENVFAQAMLPAHSELMMLDNVAHIAHIEAKELVQQRLLSFTKMCYCK